MTSEMVLRTRLAIRGGLVGVAATVPMTVLMAWSERAGIMPDQPPRRIVARLLPGLDGSTTDLVTAVSHALYGAAAGAVLAQLPLPRQAAPVIGAVYGLALWVAGYEGWVPLLGALPPGHRDHRGRVATMIAAHLLFGVAAGRYAGR